MSEAHDATSAPSGRVLWGILAVALVWTAWGLASHPAFQPIQVLRTASPVLALVLGGVFTRLVARVRQRVDGEREFDRGGKALFMGFVMVAATVLAWLVISQALPATLTVAAGHARVEAGIVARKVPVTTDADCRFRLEVTSASAATGAVQRPLDECVAESLWNTVAAGDAVALHLRQGVLGAELVGVGPAAMSR
jgi:hypothetical protein